MFFYKQHSYEQHQAKTGKKQAKVKEHFEAELLKTMPTIKCVYFNEIT